MWRGMGTATKIGILSGVGLVATFGLVAGAILLGETPVSREAIVALVVLGLLTIVAVNLEVLTRTRVGVSGSVMIQVASIVVFVDMGFLVGPVLIGLICGIVDFHLLPKREWGKIAYNAATEPLAMAGGTAACLLASSSFSTAHPVSLVVATVCAAASYLALNVVFLSIGIGIVYGEGFGGALKQIAPLGVTALPFAFLGLGLGWVYLTLGPALVPLLIVPILIARATYASYYEVKAGQEQTIETLIHALEAKDRYTAGHAQRVATFSEYVGAEFAFGERRMERLRYAALMHDIGKLVVPNQLLNKPGRLTEAEFERVKRHEPVSVELLRRIDFLAPVAGDTTTEAATAAVDGSGLVEPAIIHVADAFDAMTSTRAYRRALSQETAFSELRAGSGTQFNAQCVEAFIAAIERRDEQYGAGHEVDEHDWAVAPPEAGTGSAGLGHLVPEEQAAGQ
jgi:HD domain